MSSHDLAIDLNPISEDFKRKLKASSLPGQPASSRYSEDFKRKLKEFKLKQFTHVVYHYIAKISKEN